jgi:hypothetical protein
VTTIDLGRLPPRASWALGKAGDAYFMDCRLDDGWWITGSHATPQAAVDEGALILAAGLATAAGEETLGAAPRAAVGLSRAVAWSTVLWIAILTLAWNWLS